MIRYALPAAVGLVSLALLLLALRPDRLVVERVEFEGEVRAAEGELRHLAGVRNGTTIWEVDADAVAQGVARHPWVRSATAHRRFPNTVVVTVVEHDVVALLAYGGELFYVDGEGEVFTRAQVGDLDHPVLTGVDPALETRHPRLPALVVRDAAWLLSELERRSLLPRREVSEIAFNPTHGFAVRTRGGSVERPASEVLFGLGGYERQLARLGTLVTRGAVDLSEPVHVDLAPQRVAIVRPIEAPALALALPPDPEAPFLAP